MASTKDDFSRGKGMTSMGRMELDCCRRNKVICCNWKRATTGGRRGGICSGRRRVDSQRKKRNDLCLKEKEQLSVEVEDVRKRDVRPEEEENTGGGGMEATSVVGIRTTTVGGREEHCR